MFEIWSSEKTSSAGPCLPRASRLRVSAVLFAFEQLAVIISTISHLLLCCLQAREGVLFSLARSLNRDSLHYQKSINFQACLKAQKIGKPAPKASKRRLISNPEPIKIDFCEIFFCNTFLRNPGIRSPKGVNSTQKSITKVMWKQTPTKN